MLLYQMHLHKIPVNFIFFEEEEIEEEEICSDIKLSSVNKILLRHIVDYHKNNYLDLSVIFFKTKTKKY